MQRGHDAPEYGLPHMGHIELGIDASRLVCVFLAVERAHFTVAVLAKPRYAIGVASAHGTDSWLA